MKTTLAKKKQNNWLHMNAEGIPLGRLAAHVAFRLMGKHKPTYTPHIDQGDHVVVTNAEKVKLTGNKLATKSYQHYTGYNSGLKTRMAKELLQSKPEEVVRLAIKRMLPKGPLGKRMIRKLHIHSGTEHAHAAQQPQTITISGEIER